MIELRLVEKVIADSILQVFYTVGFSGMIYCVDVITADTSSMRDRGLAFAFTSSPYIVTAFAGPKAAEGFYGDNWRWGYGTWAIVLPVVAAPLFFTLHINQRKAIRNGILVKKQSGRTWTQSLWYYAVEFDCGWKGRATWHSSVLMVLNSARHIPDRGWPRAFSSTFLYRGVSSQRMAIIPYNCHACHRYRLPHCLRHFRAMGSTETFHPIQSTSVAQYNGCLPS